MARILLGLAVLVLGVLMLAIPTHASIIPVTFQFEDPDWSASLSFDDTTGQPWVFDSLITAYEIVSMTISDGVRTWTEDELDTTLFFPPFGGLVVDGLGRAGYFGFAFDAGTGTGLGGVVNSTPGQITDTSFSVFVLGTPTNTPYAASVASVPAPATWLLLPAGLAGFGGIAWRRRP